MLFSRRGRHNVIEQKRTRLETDKELHHIARKSRGFQYTNCDQRTRPPCNDQFVVNNVASISMKNPRRKDNGVYKTTKRTCNENTPDLRQGPATGLL